MTETNSEKELVDRKEAEILLGLRSKSSFYRLRENKDFPKPIRLSQKSVFYLRKDIIAFRESRRAG